MMFVERVLVVRDERDVQIFARAQMICDDLQWCGEMFKAIRCNDTIEGARDCAVMRKDKLALWVSPPCLVNCAFGVIEACDVGFGKSLAEQPNAFAKGAAPIQYGRWPQP